MKYLYLLFLTVFTIQTSEAQIVNIPDANFKNRLVNSKCVDINGNGQEDYSDEDADTNNDGEIQVSEALAITHLNLGRSYGVAIPYPITSLEGIEYFTNLVSLHCQNNDIVNIDLTALTSLEILTCYNNEFESIDLNALENLNNLWISSVNMTSLDLTNQINLEELLISRSQLSSLDLTNQNNLKILSISLNASLTNIDMSNLTSLEELSFRYMEIEELDLTGLINLKKLDCSNNLITNLNLSSSDQLLELKCSSNALSDINVSSNINLEFLDVSRNLLTSLNTDKLPSLTRLFCPNNQISNLYLANNSNLYYINCSNNQLTEFDISQTRISEFNCSNNQLTFMTIKNGTSYFYPDSQVNFSGNPDLQYICADQREVDGNNSESSSIGTIPYLIRNYGYTDCVLGTYCTFDPGGNFSTIQGSNTFDENNDGCDAGDTLFGNLKYNIANANGTNQGSFTADANGYYVFYIGDTYTHIITPALENPEYFTVSPENYSVNFNTDTSPFTQDFCITPNGTLNDLDITIIPLEAARPGFGTNYKITYKNKGTTTLTGSIDLMFQDDVMDLISSTPVADSQTLNNLSWNYSNLAPFETGEILITMNLNSPMETPAINGDDVLVFTATINPTSGDETPEDNVFTLNQTVVNSYDPNDKTCLEGNIITPDLIGEFVHYLIRFENTGTANAINVVVKDFIDTTKFDMNSLFLTDYSHDVATKVSNNNLVEFIFEDINLPFDDANNDGYIAFKIKTLPTLVEGDIFENEAEIYFDYNFPIITNKAQTSFNKALSTQALEQSDTISLFPNPVQDQISIKSKNAMESVDFYDITGRLVSSVSFTKNQINAEVSTKKLSSGNYFVKVKTNIGEEVIKITKI